MDGILISHCLNEQHHNKTVELQIPTMLPECKTLTDWPQLLFFKESNTSRTRLSRIFKNLYSNFLLLTFFFPFKFLWCFHFFISFLFTELFSLFRIFHDILFQEFQVCILWLEIQHFLLFRSRIHSFKCLISRKGCEEIWGSLSMQRFQAMVSNRKWAVFPPNLSSHYHI